MRYILPTKTSERGTSFNYAEWSVQRDPFVAASDCVCGGVMIHIHSAMLYAARSLVQRA